MGREDRVVDLKAVQPELENMPPRTTIVKRYLHDSKESVYETALDQGLFAKDDPQMREYVYSLYEVELDVEVDLDTGKSRILAVDGVALVMVGDFK